MNYSDVVLRCCFCCCFLLLLLFFGGGGAGVVLLMMLLYSQFLSGLLFSASGDSIVAERRTRDRKVSGSSPGRSGGRIFFPVSTFCVDSYFGIRSTPLVPQ